MNDSNDWENPLRSWTPRRPSTKLRRRIFANRDVSPGIASTDRFGARLWLAPVLGCFMVLSSLFNAKDHPMSSLDGGATNTLLATLISNQSSAAYLMAGFHSRQNGLGVDSLEWTNARASLSSLGSFPALRTNSLMR